MWQIDGHIDLLSKAKVCTNILLIGFSAESTRQPNLHIMADNLSAMKFDPPKAYRFLIVESDRIVDYEPGKVGTMVESSQAWARKNAPSL